MLSVHGGASHIRSGWKKFRELLPLLTSRVCIRRKVSYIALVSVVSCCMAAKPSHWRNVTAELLKQTYKCYDGCETKNQQIRSDITNIMDLLHQTRLRWFGYVERTDKENPVNNCRFIEVGGQRGKGRTCKTWTQLINVDFEIAARILKLRLQQGLAQNWLPWRKTIRETLSNSC